MASIVDDLLVVWTPGVQFFRTVSSKFCSDSRSNLASSCFSSDQQLADTWEAKDGMENKGQMLEAWFARLWVTWDLGRRTWCGRYGPLA